MRHFSLGKPRPFTFPPLRFVLAMFAEEDSTCQCRTQASELHRSHPVPRVRQCSEDGKGSAIPRGREEDDQKFVDMVFDLRPLPFGPAPHALHGVSQSPTKELLRARGLIFLVWFSSTRLNYPIQKYYPFLNFSDKFF